MKDTLRISTKEGFIIVKIRLPFEKNLKFFNEMHFKNIIKL